MVPIETGQNRKKEKFHFYSDLVFVVDPTFQLDISKAFWLQLNFGSSIAFENAQVSSFLSTAR